MINYIEKGRWLHNALDKLDLGVLAIDGTWSSNADHSLINAFIAAYDPLPEAQAEAINRVNIKAGETRTKYVTNVPSQDATYQMKLNDANAFKLAGYPEASITSYPFITGEAIAINSTGQVAADLIIGTADGWIQLAAGIENERRQGNESINRCTMWNDCSGLADTAIANLEAM